ncbi:MAG: sugar transferase [Streptosporangiaceae bacterium]
MKILASLVTMILIPMLVTELTDWLPWIAHRAITSACRCLPAEFRDRYREEWEAELALLPGGMAKVAFACRILFGAPATGRAVGLNISFRRSASKAFFDRTVAAAALFLLSPLFIVIAVTIRLVDGGPAFERMSVGGTRKDFTILTFRATGTRLGALLRRYDVSDLPVLINVLRGEMSLVGPPISARCCNKVGKPGVTGLHMCSIKEYLDRDDFERLNHRYVANWSFLLDIQILVRSIRKYLGRE